MSTQTNKSCSESTQQSRTVYSCPSFYLFPDPQINISAPTRVPSASKTAMKMHFEEYGLRVPLLTCGKLKRPYARSVEDLSTKSKEGLEVIVKAYTEKGAKTIKSLGSKPALAQWIERVETLAFGPHPRSKLPSTKKADVVEALGLKASVPKAKASRREKNAPERKSCPNKTISAAEEKMAARSSVSPAPKTAKPNAARRNAPKPAKVTKQVTHSASKRNYDSAVATGINQTLVKKTKTEQASSTSSALPQMSATLHSEVPAIEEATFAQTPKTTQVSDYPEKCAEMADAVELAPSHAEAQRVTEAEPAPEPAPEFEPKTGPDHRHEPKKQLEPSNSGHSHATEVDEAVHFTFIPDGYNGDACPPCKPKLEHFLKRGQHGRNGDFKDDPDLFTGRGHQVDPLDLKRKRDYEVKYYAFHTTWPYWPFINQERRHLGSDHVEGKADLDEAERWMAGYRDKYPGELVGHLWPCGCEVPRDEDESEAE